MTFLILPQGPVSLYFYLFIQSVDMYEVLLYLYRELQKQR